MWDSPSWLGTAIRAKVDADIAARNRASSEDIAEKNRQSSESIAEANRRSNERIASENRRSNETISSLNRSSNESIAELNRQSNELINRERNEVTQYGIDVQATTAAANRLLERDLTEMRILSNEKIANAEIASREGIASADRTSREAINSATLAANAEIERLRREMNVSENALNRELTASEGKLNRENQIEIARMNITQRVISDGVRLIPLVVNSSGFTFNGDGSSKPPTSTVNRSTIPSTESAKSKADSLFPTLEPTFKTGTTAAAVGATLLTLIGGYSSFVPFI